MTECCQVTTTIDTREGAERLAALAVEAGLAACAQVQGPIASTYRWRGQIEHAAEWYCHFKTTRARLPDLERLLKTEHPYELPEIVAVAIAAGNPDYLAWIEDSVRVTSIPPKPA
jgi:periplasmic divalent cation tolerance protein